jgi:hypothetical protein
MSKIFGANWWTTLWGWITLAAGAIAMKPDVIAFLPDSWEPTISGVAGLITLVAGGVFAAGVKSRRVTGGNVQQTLTGASAAEGSQSLVDLTLASTPRNDIPDNIPARVVAEIKAKAL